MSTLTTQQRVAEALLQVKAVKLQPENPFTWASGWKSPIYCDNRVTLSYGGRSAWIAFRIYSSRSKGSWDG